jgi:pyruvate dehydrogenase E2 component (dihydrolipoamide acetyltransferase)
MSKTHATCGDSFQLRGRGNMAVEFYIHKMSEHMDSAEIVQWLVAEGEQVAAGQPIIEVMTDKFAVELEAPQAGILAAIRPGCVKGAIVPVGEPIAYIVQPGEGVPALQPFGSFGAVAEEAPASSPATAAVAAPAGDPDRVGRVRSTPVARRMAKDLGLDIERLRGSGPGGRVVEADIRAAVAARTEPPPTAPPAPVPAVAGGNGFRLQDLTPIQRITGERMRESVVNAPQFALEVNADATNLLWLQEALGDRIALQAGARLSLTGLLVRIVAETLLHHPLANAQYADGRIKLLDEINVGVAVGTEQGLVVPVIKGVAGKGLAAITAELAALQEKAHGLHFAAEELSGGTFTISNLGMYGIERFAAIINPPQSAILAVGAVIRKPVALANDQVAVRPRLNLALTADHRVLDGLQAARFLSDLKHKVEKPYFVIP